MPSREVVCPHCFREVFVNTDAKCPACRRNVEDQSAETAGLKAVEFVDGEVLPLVCVVCGAASKEHVEVGEKNAPQREDRVSIVSQLFAAIGGLISIPIKPEPYRKEWRISVKLPVCERHRDSRTLQPIYIDHHRHRITVPAHPEFIARWKNAGG